MASGSKVFGDQVKRLELKEPTGAYWRSMSVQVYGCNHVAIEVDNRPRRKRFTKTFSTLNLIRAAKVTRFSSSEIINFSL
jgi:hypothetical protein